ncbi:hypothetical protein [Streptomyces sp. Ag109_O5-10]|uniref:hypothetical protein n=1 Tax=Streptomyces sp. Ag109_O5-10 TaxID=1855349 RepID=UPI00115F7D84|nr:hypothetical protein [Streptomyces sp. Ag109_O5-10]
MRIVPESPHVHTVAMLYLQYVLEGDWVERRRLEKEYPNLSASIAAVGLKAVDEIALPAVRQAPDIRKEKRILNSRQIFATRESVPPRVFSRLQTRMLALLVLRLISAERTATGFSRREERLFGRARRAQRLRELAGK